MRRYEEEGEKGLRDRSRRPHISPLKTSYHPKRLRSNRLGTPIFSPKEKRRGQTLLPCPLGMGSKGAVLSPHTN
ncbi:hypothetical protein CEE36_05865 [candidate division TA06 bacterium B3_TA06]|uniref:Uncharacterized protein n=1 Tax=candidate division TA06 bacterium B3_TA06 TaxID=2012487 RepID=A0A532V759_UNCT6|nr:MAG: hypothetical protein CEE36_05865 [candidate division TA06 bacterium B3_TA06]